MAIKKKLRPNELLMLNDGSAVKNITQRTVHIVLLKKEETDRELLNQSSTGTTDETNNQK